MKTIIIFIIILLTKTSFSLTINETVKSTIENNKKVKIALEKLNESKEIIETAVGKKLPVVTGTISGTYSNSDSKTVTGSTTPETFTDKYKISATQNLLDGGAKDLEIEKAKLLFNNEMLSFYKTIQNLSLTAINGYLTVNNYKKSLEATKKNYDSVLRFLEETKLKYELGSSTITDLKNAEAAFAIAETNVFSANQNFDISLKTFKSVVGKDAINLEELINFENELDLNKILQNVLENNYDILIAKNNIDIKNIELSKVKSSTKPSLDLTASAEYSDASRLDNGTENSNASIGLTLNIPIFQQNLNKSESRKFISQILQSEMVLYDLRDNLSIDVSNYFKDYMVSLSTIDAALKTIEYATILLESTNEEYNLGTKSITDLINAETELLDANVQYFSANQNYLINYFNLLALDGSLIELFKEYLPKYN